MTNPTLRYTGCWPPIEVLTQYPNWEYAIDEEPIEGQDETTIRPASNQSDISQEVAFTAGVVTQPNGQRLTAILEITRSKIEGFTVNAEGRWSWSMRLIGKPAIWVPITFEWLPESERPPSVLTTDQEIFPLVVQSNLLVNGKNIAAYVTIERRQ
jgi:hypothetical protein